MVLRLLRLKEIGDGLFIGMRKFKGGVGRGVLFYLFGVGWVWDICKIFKGIRRGSG